MGKVGHFGKLEFYVKTKKGKPKLQSFDEMKWNSSINVEEHKRQGKKPLLEVTGKNCDEIFMNIYFYAQYGVNPWKKLLLLRKYNQQGKVFPLVIGGKRVGSFKWIISDVSNELKTFYKNGKVTEVVAAVSFKEYPYKKGKSKKKKIVKSSKKNTAKSGSSSASKSSSAKSSTKKGYQKYTIVKGDTLWDLARKYYKNGTKYVKIYNANKEKSAGFDVISDPAKLTIGWVIKIPL